MESNKKEPTKWMLIDQHGFAYLTKESADKNEPDFYLDKTDNTYKPIKKNIESCQ